MSAEWLFALGISPVLHLAWVKLAEWLFPLRVDLRTVAVFLTGYDNETATESAFGVLASSWESVAVYFLSIYLAAGFFGVLLHLVIRWKKLDCKYPVFRFNNQWHYLFSGELHDSNPRPHGALVTAAVESSTGTTLYAGLLEGFSYGQDGDLQKIELTGAVRRSLSNDRKGGQEQQPVGDDQRYYRIEGHRLILWCEDIATLNIRYYERGEDGKPKLLN
jgi:hypothetical protein